MDELWDIIRLSSYLGVKRSTLYALVEKKEIPHYRIGRLARFKPAEIEEWLEAKRYQGAAIKKERKKICVNQKGSTSAVKQIVIAAIDELNPGRYNCSGKTDRIKGLEKEG